MSAKLGWRRPSEPVFSRGRFKRCTCSCLTFYLEVGCNEGTGFFGEEVFCGGLGKKGMSVIDDAGYPHYYYDCRLLNRGRTMR
jgi:hypothetical protein